MSPPPLLFSLLTITLSLLTASTTALPPTTITAASEILSNTPHNSISLTLPLLSTTLPSLPSATLFAPSDPAFALSSSGQPSLSLLHFHFCPRLYSPSDLLSLPYASLLPTLLPNSSLSVSSTVFDDFFSLNGVRITDVNSPLFDDGFFIVYSVDRFFTPSLILNIDSVSELSPEPSYFPSGLSECRGRELGLGAYWEAAAVLRTRGYSIMAGFLDVQVGQFGQEDDEARNVTSQITIFAPRDDVLKGYFRNHNDWGSVFLRHVVGCGMSWTDLVRSKDGGIFGTFLKGFGITIGNNSAGSLVINGNFTVDFPDFYRSDRVLIHGLSGILTVPPEVSRSGDGQHVSSAGGSYTPSVVLKAVSDHGEF